MKLLTYLRHESATQKVNFSVKAKEVVKMAKNDVNGIYKGKRSCGPKLTQKPEKKICEKIEILEKQKKISSELGMSILFVTSISIGPGGTLELWGNLQRDSFQQLDAETGKELFSLKISRNQYYAKIIFSQVRISKRWLF